MLKTLLSLLIRAAISAAAMLVMYKFFAARGLVMAAPIVGISLARPIVDAVWGFPRLLSRLVLRKVEGRYFEWRGRSLDIHIDAHAACWVSTADARKLVALPDDVVLNRAYPLHCRETGEPRVWRISETGLSKFLARATQAESVKFLRWLETDVARPARKRLELESDNRRPSRSSTLTRGYRGPEKD